MKRRPIAIENESAENYNKQHHIYIYFLKLDQHFGNFKS